MKKLVMILSLIATTAVFGGSITVNYSFDDPGVIYEDNGARLSIPKCFDYYEDFGAPMMPVYIAHILLPDAANVTGVSVEVTKASDMTFESPLVISQPPAGLDRVEPRAVFAAGTYPIKRAEFVEVQSFHTWKIATVRVFPITMDSELHGTMANKLALKLEYDLTDDYVPTLGRRDDKRRFVKEYVDNPGDMPEPKTLMSAPVISDLHTGLGSTYDWLLICDQKFTNAFQRLVDHRRDQGLRPLVKTTQELIATYKSSPTENPVVTLRHAIQDLYTKHGITYLLLGGDVDTISHKYIKTGGASSQGICCDMWYSCLADKEDMDHNGDGHAGSPNDGDGGKDIDHTAEVYVGRAPVETVADVDIFVRKTIRHDNDLDDSLSVLFAAEYMGNGRNDFGGNALDEWESFMKPLGYSSTWLDDRPNRSAGAAFTSAETIETLNRVSPAVFAGMGHGVLDGVLRIHSKEIPQIKTRRPFFALSTACAAGCFYVSSGASCIAEEFIRGTRVLDGGEPITNECYGAWGVILNSGTGWYNYGNEKAYSGQIYCEILRNATVNGRTIGRALADARSSLWSTGSTMRWAVLDPNLLGDPACYLILDDLRVNNFDSFEATYDSSTTPNISKQATLHNSGSASLAWRVETPDWITASPTSGNLAAGANVTVTFSVNNNAKNLPCGINAEDIRFISPHNAIRRPARVRVYNSTVASFQVTTPTAPILAESSRDWSITAKTSGNATATKYNGAASLFVGQETSIGVNHLDKDTFTLGSAAKYFLHRFIINRQFVSEKGIIKSISFNISSGPNITSGTIRLRRFARTAYSLVQTETLDDNCWTTVYSGTIPFASGGWVKIDLDAPFYYDPNEGDNLELEIAGYANSVAIKYIGIGTANYISAIYRTGGSAVATGDSIKSESYNTRKFPALSLGIIKAVSPIQSATLSSGAGVVPFVASSGQDRKVYAMDGETLRGDATVSFDNWGLVWTQKPANEIELGKPCEVTIQAQNTAGTLLTEISGTCNITPADPSGNNDLVLQYVSQEPNNWPNVDIDTKDGGRAKRMTTMYTFGEVGGAGTIGSVSLYVGLSEGGSITIPNFTLRMKDAATAGELYNGTLQLWQKDMSATGWTECYRGPLTIDGVGWVKIPFTTPFVYKGEHQLIVDVSYWYESGAVDADNRKVLGKSYNNTNDDIKRVINALDAAGAYGDPRNWDHTSSVGPTATVTSFRPWMRFHKSAANFCSAIPSSFPLVNGEWSGFLTPSTLGSNLVFCADLNGGHHGCSSVFNVREKVTGAPSNIDYRSFDIGYTIDASYVGGTAYVVYSKKADLSEAQTNTIANVTASGTASLSSLDFASTYYARVIVVKNGSTTFSDLVTVNTLDPEGTLDLGPVQYEVGEYGASVDFNSTITRLVAGADRVTVRVSLAEFGGEYEEVAVYDNLGQGDAVNATVTTLANKVYLYRIVAESTFLGQKWYSTREGVFETEFITESSWFNVDFETYTAGSAWMTTIDGSGTWTRELDGEDAESKVEDLSGAYTGRQKSLVQPGDASYARYTATAAAPADCGNRVNFRAKMYMKAGTEPPSSVTEDLLTNCIASVYLKVSEDGSTTNYCGYVTSGGNAWVDLHADGISLVDCAFHDVEIDVDYAFDVPKVRFNIDGYTLIDDNSTVWFDRANADLGVGTAKLSSVAFLGNTKVDEFSAMIAEPDEGVEEIPDGKVASTGKGGDRAYYDTIADAFAASAVNGLPVRLLADAVWTLANGGDSVSVQTNGHNFTISQTAGNDYYLKTVSQGQTIVYIAQEKEMYDLSGITFADDTVEWDGAQHSIVISGTLPNGVSVNYSGNGQSSIGEYTITASFTGDTTMHKPIPNRTATLRITQVNAGTLENNSADWYQVGENLVATMKVSVAQIKASPATLVLTLNGETVKTWNSVAVGEYAAEATVKKGLNYTYRFTLSGGESTPVSVDGAFKALKKTKWIDVDRDPTDVITDGAVDSTDLGTWSTNGLYRYTARTQSKAKCDAYVLTRVQFPSVNTNEVAALPIGTQTAVFIFPENSSYCLKAWNGSAWVKLTGMIPVPENWYDIKIEFAYANNCSRQARVTVGSTVLTVGETADEWFAIGGTERKLTSVGFFGELGIDDFEGWYYDGLTDGFMFYLRGPNN